MVKVIKQDLRGRRPAGEGLDPVATLFERGPGQASRGEGVVAWPASKYAIEAQTIYKEFYGTRALDARSLEPQSPAELLRDRHTHAKPALGSVRSAGPRSVGARVREHGRAVAAAVAASSAGAGGEGPLGPVGAPQPRQPQALAQIVAATSAAGVERAEYVVARPASASSQATSRATPAGAPFAAGAEAAAEVVLPGARMLKRKAPDVGARQREVLAAKRAALVRAPAGALPPYVGPRGEVWRPSACASSQISGAPRGPRSAALSQAPRLCFLAPDCPSGVGGTITFMGYTVVPKLRACEIVLTDSVAGRWLCVEALAARLYGKWFADIEWVRSNRRAGACLRLCPSLGRNVKLFLSDGFRAQWPRHTTVLDKASIVAQRDFPKGLRVMHGACAAKCGANVVRCVSDEEARGATTKECKRTMNLKALLQLLQHDVSAAGAASPAGASSQGPAASGQGPRAA